MAAGLAAWSAGTIAADAPAPADARLLLAVSINDVDHGDVVMAWRPAPDGDGFALPRHYLDARGLRTAGAGLLQLDGVPYVRLGDLPGVQGSVDAPSQTLLVRAAPSAFVGTTMATGDTPDEPLTPSRVGGFLNYDLAWQRDSVASTAGGLFEAGLFGRWGSLTATALRAGGRAGRGLVRLDTTWVVDLPARMQSLRIGDAITRPGTNGRSVRFGGIQWGTNFATRPAFVAQPQPALHGEAVMPSTLDLFVDNVRVLQGQVPAGPFDLPSVPVLSGQGEVRLVVSDLLGRQHVIAEPYYASRQLLKPGLHDFSFEAGAIREDYGLASMHYGRRLLAASDRVGLTPGFTGEWRLEALHRQGTVGAGGAWLLPRLGGTDLGTLSFGAAHGRGPDGRGELYSLGIERQARGLSFGLLAQQAGRGFVQLGQVSGHTLRESVSANVGLSLDGRSIALGHLQQSSWEGGRRRTASLNYSQRLGRDTHLGLYALQSGPGRPRPAVGAMLTLSLGPHTTLSADAGRQGGREQAVIQLQHNPPIGGGVGYRLLASGQDNHLASAVLDTDRATWSAEAARFGNHAAWRAGVAGGVAVADGALFPSRRIDDSFAVLKVADYAGVRVYRDHHEIARTDREGRALVPGLRAYERNMLGIELADLPVEAGVDALEIGVTPALRSGVVVDFPVRREAMARFRLTDAHGTELPPGAIVRSEGGSREFPVGFGGLVFASGLPPGERLTARWGGRRCEIEAQMANRGEPIADLGTLVCREAAS